MKSLTSIQNGYHTAQQQVSERVSFCHCIMLANCGSCSQGKPIHQGCLSLSTQIAPDAVVSLDKGKSGWKPEGMC